MESLIQTITVYAIPVLLAITLHEASHGYVARLFGDNTAFVAGRVTLNPLKHVDPVGTIAVPIAILLFSKLLGGAGFFFGWARPVPVDFDSLRHPKRDMIFVAAAGPLSNFLMAVLWVLLNNLLAATAVNEQFFYLVAQAGVEVNLIFMALNLLPIPPLDGGRIVVGLLPHPLSAKFARIEPYGIFILLVLMMTQTLGLFISPFLQAGIAVLRLIS